MEIIAFQAKEIFGEQGIETERLLLIKDGRFAGFISNEEAAIRQITVKYFGDCRILPGLFDSHIHGALGKDTMDASPEAIDSIGRYLLSQGTTSWMPTTVTAGMENIYKALKNLAVYKAASTAARVCGCFVEGPYLTEEHRGAHPTEYLRNLSEAEFDELLAMGPMKTLAIAPEKEGALAFIQRAVSKGVHISLAHTNADYETSVQAMRCGADAVVHTFCGMRPMHHRSPNLAGAALVCDEVYAELIADGIHVHKAFMKLLCRCKPKDKIILVSDSISAAGLADGKYVLGVETVQVKDEIPRTSSGSLAGSTTTLLSEVRRLILELGEDPLDTVHMASLNPSRRFGLGHEIGSIKAGKTADFLIVDSNYRLREVWKQGKQVVDKEHENE